MLLDPLGLAPGPVVPTREWRELYAALANTLVAAIHPFYRFGPGVSARRAPRGGFGAGGC